MIYTFEIDSTKYFFDGNSLQLYKDFFPEESVSAPIKAETSNILKKAVFNVANVCNGQCIYCYEKGGNFGRPNAIMDREAADKVLNIIFREYDHVELASFFGGEPTLNYKIIQYIVNELEKRSFVSGYEITTNAINMDDDMIAFFIKNNFKVIISIDGPEVIHNQLRRNCTHKKVEEVIQKLKESTIGSLMELNCTYTKLHEESLSYDELIRYFENLGVKYHISNVITDIEWLRLSEKQMSERELIDDAYENLAAKALNVEIPGTVKNIIQALVRREYKNKFCYGLCHGNRAVFDCYGEQFPCEALLYECKIDDPRISLYNEKSGEACSKCWAKGLCSHCTADFILGRAPIPYKDGECNKKELYGYALKKLVSYYHREPEKFQTILDNYYS